MGQPGANGPSGCFWHLSAHSLTQGEQHDGKGLMMVEQARTFPQHYDHPYESASTLRSTIQPVLERLGCGWADVRGLSVTVHDRLSPEWGDRLSGEIHPSRLASLLDAEAEEVVARSAGWGYDQDNTKFINFSATVWLDDCTIQFSPRHFQGTFVGCDIVPTKPPAEFRLDLSSGLGVNP